MWGSYAELHPETATALGIELGDVLVVSDRGRRGRDHRVPAHGDPPRCHRDPGRPRHHAARSRRADSPVRARGGRDVFGVNAFQLIPGKLDPESGALAWLSTHATVKNTKKRATVTRAQLTFDQEDRGFGKAVALSALPSLKPWGAEGDEGGHEKPGDPERAAAATLAGRRRAPADQAVRRRGGRASRQPVPLGHVDRPGRLHRLQRLHRGLHHREQHPGGRARRTCASAARCTGSASSATWSSRPRTRSTCATRRCCASTAARRRARASARRSPRTTTRKA